MAQAPSAASTSKPAVSASQRAAATALINLINPDDRILAQQMHGWELAMQRRLGVDPTVAKLETAHPGIADAGIAAARPLAQAHVSKMLQATKRLGIEITARNLSSAELAEVYAFYGTPVGRKIARGMTEPKQADHLINRIAPKFGEGDSTITQQDANAAIAKATEDVMTDVSASESLEVMRFEGTPAARKLRDTAQEVQREALKIINTPDPEFSEQQDKVVIDAMLAFAERRQGK